MKVTTPFTITAADSEARTITGKIVEFDVPANASTGKVMFKSGSLNPANVKLNLEHDSARPIGKTLQWNLHPMENQSRQHSRFQRPPQDQMPFRKQSTDCVTDFQWKPMQMILDITRTAQWSSIQQIWSGLH